MSTREDTPLLRPNHTLLKPYQTEDHYYEKESVKYTYLELQYLLLVAMMGGVTGLTTISVTTLAENCNTTALSLGVIFIFQAMGSLMGSGLSIWLYKTFYNNVVLLYNGLLLSFLFLYICSVTSVSVLCLFFTLFGCFHVIIQIGCISFLRKIHPSHLRSISYINNGTPDEGSSGGYWLALTQLAYGIGALLFVFLYAIGVSAIVNYYLLCISLTTISIMMIAYVNPEDKANNNNSSPSTPQNSTLAERCYHTQVLSDDEHEQEHNQPINTIHEGGEVFHQQEKLAIPKVPSHYHAEMLIGLTLFLLHGMSLSVSAYLETYADETASESTTIASYQITVFWLAVCVGRVIGALDQCNLVSRGNIIVRISAWIFGSCICALFWFGFPYTLDSIWVCVVLMGFLFGPTTGYCLDLLHRITIPTVTSTALVLMIMNVGGLIVVYLCAVIWNSGAGALTLVYTSFITLLLSTPFVWFARGVSYVPEVRQSQKPEPYLRPFY